MLRYVINSALDKEMEANAPAMKSLALNETAMLSDVGSLIATWVMNSSAVYQSLRGQSDTFKHLWTALVRSNKEPY